MTHENNQPEQPVADSGVDVFVDTTTEATGPTTALDTSDLDPLDQGTEEVTGENADEEQSAEDMQARRVELDPFDVEDSKYVTMKDSPYGELKFEKQVPLAFVPISATKLSDRISKWPQFNVETEALTTTLNTIYAGAYDLLAKGIYEEIFKGPDRDWHQNVHYEGKDLEVGSPSSKSLPKGTKLSGDKATQAISVSMGVGTLVQTPLWHSGFWIWLKPPTTGQLIDLEETISNEKINLGRNKLGLPFSNSTVYIVHHLTNFILGQIYDTTLDDSSFDNIVKNIKITDWFRLVHTLAITLYPNGYSMDIPCTADVEKCHEITHVNANLAKMLWTDRLALTPAQTKHMADRRGSMTKESIAAYTSEGRFSRSKRVPINDLITLVLKVPSLHEYLATGMAWIDGIVESVEQMFAEKSGDRATRERIMLRHAEASSLREYEHWIDYIEVDGAIVDKGDIGRNLDIIAGDPTAAQALRKGILEYIDDVTISIVATPRYRCKCGEYNNKGSEVDKHPFLTPLDPVKLFFNLGDRRTSHTKVN